MDAYFVIVVSFFKRVMAFVAIHEKWRSNNDDENDDDDDKDRGNGEDGGDDNLEEGEGEQEVDR